MKTQQTLVQLAAAIATSWLMLPAAQANTTQQGVKCPSGSTALISNSNKHLACQDEERIERASTCSAVVFEKNGDITFNQRIEHIKTGSDVCRGVTTGATKPSQALLLPGDNIADFHREVRANGEDVFVRVKTIYKFPEGGPIYVGNAANGVQCEAGYDGDKMFDGKGIRCDRRETRKAVCDIGWTFDSNPGKDKCFIEKIVFGNKVRVDGQYTIPEGTTGALGNPEQLGWDLKQDHSGNRDYWAKEGKDYKFPKSL